MPEVTLSPEAVEDILTVYNFILECDGEAPAEAILTRLETRCYSLDKSASRGKFPDELTPFGNQKIGEVRESQWRIFYRAELDKIIVLAVLDGRRSMQELLLERMAR